MNEYTLKTRFPRASKTFLALNADAEVSSTEPERNQTPALGSAVQRKTKGVPRFVVRFIGFRVRPLDPDNFAGGCKDLLDGLRHAQLISGDEPWKIIFQTTQEKVNSYKKEKTVIEIYE